MKKKDYLCTYDNKFKYKISIDDIKHKYEKYQNILIKTCGRVTAKRVMGKNTFIDIKGLQEKIQIYIKNNNIENYKILITNINLGDIIGVNGLLFKTKTNEISINTKKIRILSKNINTFPDKRFGLIDKEIRYRKRYLDLMINDENKKLFIARSKIISEIRHFFLKKKYIEVETPIMQNITGGADAKPFKTYHNYLDDNLCLRISPELNLKKLIVGGFEKIFEIGKNFRNENLSNRHHPEFTSIEFYEAYADYKKLMKLTEDLFKTISKNVFKTYIIDLENKKYDLSKKFKKIKFFDALLEIGGFNKKEIKNKKYITTLLKKEEIIITKEMTLEKLQSKLFEHFVEKKLIEPTFILNHPKEISPLARSCDKNKKITERFELYINGKEIANGFSELNDPFEQEKRFKKQIENKNEKYDTDYIEALKYGLPPTAGEGIGIDRLIMFFTNSKSIKDVILFPLMKIK